MCVSAMLLFLLCQRQQVSAKNYNTWFEAIRFNHFLKVVFIKTARLCLTESALKKALLFRQTSEEIFIKIDHLWALTLKRERHKVGSKTRAIEKSDKLMDMGS